MCDSFPQHVVFLKQLSISLSADGFPVLKTECIFGNKAIVSVLVLIHILTYYECMSIICLWISKAFLQLKGSAEYL